MNCLCTVKNHLTILGFVSVCVGSLLLSSSAFADTVTPSTSPSVSRMQELNPPGKKLMTPLQSRNAVRPTKKLLLAPASSNGQLTQAPRRDQLTAPQ